MRFHDFLVKTVDFVWINVLIYFCGPYRIRTGDLLVANEALYQLS
jgi:hypothetical protein